MNTCLAHPRYGKAKRAAQIGVTATTFLALSIAFGPRAACWLIGITDVNSLLDAIVDRDAPIAANRVFSAGRKMFNGRVVASSSHLRLSKVSTRRLRRYAATARRPIPNWR